MRITSAESLDTAVAEICRLKIEHTAAIAAMEAEVAAVQKRHQEGITRLAERISDRESVVLGYCEANRSELFPEVKSRETPSAVFGFQMTPPRVETSSRKIKWTDVIERLQRLDWGPAYVREAAPKVDKEALLADRGTLTPEQCAAAGIRFIQDENFYIRPKSDVAEATVTPT